MRIAYTLLLACFISGFVSSCKKSSPAATAPAVTKPRVGTVWKYRYKTFDGAGVVYTTTNIIYKASSEQTLGGEKWLNITDSTNATVFLLNVKTGGLYQYANNTSNLLCKDPAAVNDAYTSYNEGSAEDFTTKEVSVLLAAPINDVTVNRYEGVKGGNLTDIYWYNSDLWMVKREFYKVNLMGFWHINKRWELTAITY